MRKLILFLLLLATPTWAQIAHVNTTTATGGCTGSPAQKSISVTVGSGSNRLLVLASACRDNTTNADCTWTGVTYGSSSLTKVDRRFGGNNGTTAEQWYLVAPATGTADLVISCQATTDYGAYTVLEYSGVAQTSTLNTSAACNNGFANTITCNLTTTVDNAWIVMSAAISGHDVDITWGTDQTERSDLVETDVNGGASDKDSGGAGADSVSVTTPVTHSIAGVAAAYAPASTTSTTGPRRRQVIW